MLMHTPGEMTGVEHTRQAVHMTLPVPEQKGQVSSPPFLAVV